MSMVYGESSDLINGGSGGGLHNFWRSRTSFERKLLVSLLVMVVIIIGLIVALAIIVIQQESSPYYSSCPNSKFEDKHVCTTCKTVDDALAFTKQQRGEPTKIPLNTVFGGHDILYTDSSYNNEESSLIIKPVKTWTCHHDGNGIWTSCQSQGLCTGHSAVSNGHFFSESLDCH